MQIKRIFTDKVRWRTTIYLLRSRFLMRAGFSRSTLFIRVTSLLLCYSLIVPFYALVPRSRIAKASAAHLAKPRKGSTSIPRRSIQTAQKARWRDGELLVRFRQNVPQSDVDALLQANGAQRSANLRGQFRIERLRLTAGSDPEAIAASFRSSQKVDF